MTESERNWAIKKIEAAIDRMIDLQDAGYGNNAIARVLGELNSMRSDLDN